VCAFRISLHKCCVPLTPISICDSSIDADLEGVLSVTDNDSLAANVSTQLNADLLMILSDVDGIYK